MRSDLETTSWTRWTTGSWSPRRPAITVNQPDVRPEHLHGEGQPVAANHSAPPGLEFVGGQRESTIYSFAEVELDTGSFELRRRGSREVIAVEPQVFDVLRFLVEHADRVVSKEELLDSVWGTRFVTESAITSRIKTARRAVGDDGRAQQVIRTVHGRGYRFVATVERQERGVGGASAAALAATLGWSRSQADLQLPQNSFVGRGEELIALQALLARTRWVTVVGPAGCGKTRLALETAVADARVPVVVEMEHASAETVVNAVAQAVGLGADGSADGFAPCAAALSARPHLLILDNCDRVADAVTVMVRALMARVQSLTVLATSRSPLGGTDETIYALDPLPVADGADAAAVRLFLDRASSAAPAVQLSDADLATVARICRHLDGVPLAIELAAARVRHLPVAELAVRLEDGIPLLGRPGAGSRHRTLEAAFDWTWDLLDADEQRVLSQLAAIPRTFDLKLAEAVTAPGVARIVLGLLDRSLVSPAAGPSQPARYRLLGSLRSFLLARADPTIVHAARLAHAEYHDRHAGELARRIRIDDSRPLGQRATPHHQGACRRRLGVRRTAPTRRVIVPVTRQGSGLIPRRADRRAIVGQRLSDRDPAAG
jgi:predicted ATPase/DNA-binding winged helix-turn-helix (wHTH) protein